MNGYKTRIPKNSKMFIFLEKKEGFKLIVVTTSICGEQSQYCKLIPWLKYLVKETFLKIQISAPASPYPVFVWQHASKLVTSS